MEKSMRIKPLFDKVVIGLEPDTVSEGGILLPAFEEPLDRQRKGVVIAVGEGRRDGKGNRIPNGLKAGQRVLIDKWSVAEVIVEGKKMFLAIVDGIIGVIDDN